MPKQWYIPSMPRSPDIMKQIFYAAVDAANPYKAVRRACDEIGVLFRDGSFARLLVIGFGKASPAMAQAVEESLGDLVDSGIVITKYGHGPSFKQDKIRLSHAGHPIPDENGRAASEQITDLVAGADEKTLVVTLISGGGSALFVSPSSGVSLAEKRMTTDLLLKAGADIGELNTVRKHLSRVKGGRLAEIIHPATTVSLILSDVIGDRLDIIASGPTVPDPTTYSDAFAVLARYGLVKRVPESVAELLVKGQMGIIPETPKPGNPVFTKVTNKIIGCNRLALEAARDKAGELGFRTEILSAEISGEARETGRWLAHKALAVRRTTGMQTPLCLISGGETTVNVTGAGKGGRNMELALSFAMEIEGVHGISLLSAGTDGTDGPTDAAGAVVDGTTTATARARGIDPETHLRDNDSYNFFRKIGELFITGPTGTNVMDVQVVLIEADGMRYRC
jgi:hydroxypyruvate reductase/glycerate 2-kinase